MSRFHDIQAFVQQHRPCGALTPTASEPAMGGYFLTLTCACGVAFDRWVTEEESRDLPNLMAGSAAPRREPEPPVVQTLTEPSGESLQDLMQQALESVEKAAPPPAPRPPSRPAVSPLQAALESTLAELGETTEAPPPPPPPPPRQPPPARVEAPAVNAPVDATRAAPPASPPRAAPPSRQARPAPAPRPPAVERPAVEIGEAAPPPDDDATAPPAPSRKTRRETPVLTVDRDALEEVMKRALEEVGTAKPGTTSAKPDKVSLEKALRTALHDYDAETRKLGGPGAGRRVIQVDLGPSPTPAPRRRLSVAGALVVAALLGAVAGLWYAAHWRAGAGVVIASGPGRPAKPPLADDERAALNQAMSVLRELQGMSRADVPYRVYFSRVSFAKADIDRYMQDVKDLEVRNTVQGVLSLHLLAATAWRAKTINDRERWEAVGDDPTVELCPPVKRLLAVGDEPQSMSRSQWRGIALAAGVPVLWDCAAERIAEADKRLR